MSTIEKIILVTASHHPLHKLWVEIAKEIAKRLGVELEIREEDYIFVNEYGEKDDLGMAWLPQLFAKRGDRYIVILAKIPLNDELKPDKEKAISEALQKLEQG